MLNAVVPERSGMAASATNTSREIGAVTGVSILGALVFSQLNSSLTRNLLALNVPVGEKSAHPRLQVKTIVPFIETGQAPTNYSAYGPVVGKVISAAYAFPPATACTTRSTCRPASWSWPACSPPPRCAAASPYLLKSELVK